MASQKSHEKPLCYVIGPIGAPESRIRRDADMLYHSIIEEAVGGGYHLLRADKEHKAGMITDMIIQRVHDAEIVIADLTTLNPNVFYELGIRHAAQKPTIHVAQVGTELPFDTQGYNTVFYDVASWDSHTKTRAEIAKQVEEINNPNYSASNPVTHALTMQVFNASADTEEKAIAVLEKRIKNLEMLAEINTRQIKHHLEAPTLLGSEIRVDRTLRERAEISQLYREIVAAASKHGANLPSDVLAISENIKSASDGELKQYRETLDKRNETEIQKLVSRLRE
jgi:hypothetical protein